jgi:hypothetical protein
MSTLTSRPEEPKMRPSRNFTYLLEQQTMQRYRDLVVRELLEYLGEGDKREIRLTPKDDLCTLHHSLGMAIRNEYELWMPEHEVTAIFHKCEASHPLVNEPANLPTEIRVGDRMVNISGTSVHVDEHPCHPDNFSMSCVRQLWEALQ